MVETTSEPAPRNANPIHFRTCDEYLDSAETLFAARHIEQALTCYLRAVERGVDPNRGALNRWTCLMLLGRFEEAWKETDRTEAIRRARGVSDDGPLHLRRVWDGTPFENKIVLVRCYHGLGDTIQFIRYVPMVKRISRAVVVEAPGRILPLLRCMPEIDEVVPLDGKHAPIYYDVEIEAMELAYAFRTTVETVPAQVPYISVDGAAVQKARQWMQRENRTRIGLVWSAGEWNPSRSLPLAEVLPLTRLPNVALYSLQRQPSCNSVEECGPDIVNIEGRCRGIVDTAAVVLNLDLVISVDTMVAHLAGALGRSVWTLLPFASDWRWMTRRVTTPWYPTMRLFRQPQPGDWKAVLELVMKELANSDSFRHGNQI